MAINKDSNAYTISFAIILVVLVGGLLAFVSTSLKPMQLSNVKNEKKQNILNSLPGINFERSEAEGNFNKYVKKRVILDYTGNVVDGSVKTSTDDIKDKDTLDAFNIDLQKEYRNIAVEARNYPLFECEIDGKTFYVLPVTGKGLWDAIWGYISVESDGESIAGAVFDHKAETPGLGAEINKDEFEDQFDALKIGRIKSNSELSAANFRSIKVVKPGSLSDKLTQVDGISGGTFTSVGVQEMLKRTFYVYYKHFNENKLETANL
ncbi:MAG: NADH:ubiquinone reductase (Na(+)-transporting) subunit C [Flavobacteriales bacterium]|nr:NADH:ubiquinone reductase (Na(+)-transporting) subunit C [Flavobacteriales bacterium]